ncbi:MAG: DUF2911 domain-containing protein [Gemmatimonadaceae bacterium]
MSVRHAFAAVALCASVAQAQVKLTADLSGRASTQAGLAPPRVQGAPAPKPLLVKIDYGQPAVRNREVPVELATLDSIWRVGANTATTLTSDVDLMIGDLPVPKGAYSLYATRTANGYLLIVNKATGQSGAVYDASKDLGRLALTPRTRHEVQESLHIALKSADDRSPRGSLLISWGLLDLSTSWSAR